MRNLMVLMLAFFIPTVAMSYDGWSGTNQIGSIRVYSDELVLVTIPEAANPGGCSLTDYLSLANPETESGKRRYAAMLSAYVAGKSVSLALTGCSDGGISGYPLIEQVWLK